MRLRTLLATAVAGALTVGAASAPALAMPVPDPAGAGTLVTWGDPTNPNGGPALTIPEDLAGPLTAVAATNRATGVVTLDGHVRIWGASGAAEWEEAPSGITDAVAISLASNQGAVLHEDGTITGWGMPDGVDPAPLSVVPTDLRAKAIAVHTSGTGYAIRPDGTLATWGADPVFALPTSGLTDLVDIAVSNVHMLALRADGTIVTWGAGVAAVTAVPDFGGKKVVAITAAGSISGVVFEDGTIDVWGTPLPAGEPAFDGTTPATTVTSLSVWSPNAAAVTEDGVVHAWGSTTAMKTLPESLTGAPVSSVTLGNFHEAAIVTAFRDLTKPTIAGTPQVGQTLTATPATFSLTPDEPATGQWFAGGDPIEDQTGTTLALDPTLAGETITYRSSAERDGETVESASEPAGPVALVPSTTTLGVSPAKGAVGSARTVTATVTSTGPAPTGTVTFALGATEVVKPLTAGKASWTLPTSLKAGAHQVSATYDGDDTTSTSSSSATVTITKAGATLTAKAKATGRNGKIAKLVKVSITVKAPAGVSPAGKVTVTLKGKTKKTVTVKVDAKGKATASFKKVKAGKYQVTLKYAGNADVSAANGKTTVKA